MKRIRLSGATASVIALAGLFLLVLMLATVSLLWSDRESDLAESEAKAALFVNGAEAALNNNLLEVDVMLASLDEQLELSKLVPEWIDMPAANRLMHAAEQQNLLVQSVALMDAQGRVMASSDASGAASAPTLPPGFVQDVLAQPIATLSASVPVVSFTSSEWVIYFGRSIVLADSSKVLAVAEVPVSLLTSIMIQGADIKGLEVTLERGNGQLLASAPAFERLLGRHLSPPLGGQLDAERALRWPARISGAPALLVTRPILSRDLLISAAIPIDSALAGWRTQRNYIVAAALLFALMIVAAAGSVIWYLERLGQARQAILQAKLEIEQLAFFDPLTGLPNRRLLMDRLQQAMASSARSARYGALLFLDLDNFKTLNDTLGHDVGDLLLQQVAGRLRACVREQDTVSRLGGDEFVVMLEGLAEHGEEAAAMALHVGEKIVDQLNQPYELNGRAYRSTPSVGATLFSGRQQDAAELLKQADIAMYEVKSSGRNALRFFDPQMQATIVERAQLEQDLQVAVREQQFLLYYQPQVELAGQVRGAEALIRWQHPQRGLVPLHEFIAVAEDSEWILPIGNWVLRTACQQLAAWRQHPTRNSLQLAVNVSARQFRQANFVTTVAAALHDSGASAQMLTLELTESLMLVNGGDTLVKLSQLKALGVRCSVDDFGNGCASLAHLARLPLDQLKIAPSLVRAIGMQESDGLIVRTIIGMARSLGLEVIAEGVETQAQQEFLLLHGCTRFQGGRFGAPTPLEGFEALVRQHESNGT